MYKKLLTALALLFSSSALADGALAFGTKELPFEIIYCKGGRTLQIFSPNTQSIYIRYQHHTFNLPYEATPSSSGYASYTNGQLRWKENLRSNTAVLLQGNKVLESCSAKR